MDETLNHASRPYPMIGIAAVQPFLPARALDEMRDRFGASDASCRLRFHTQTGGVTLTAQQPLNNVVRVTVQTLAATLGGTQSLHTNGYDEALALPTAEAATLALRTQQIVAFESGITGTVDPLAGSYYVGWDLTYLYLAAKVRDDKYVQVSTGENIFKGDSLELILDTNLLGDFYNDSLSADDYQI